MLKTFIKSIYAGGLIGLGGIAYMASGNKLHGAVLFSIGLVAILIFGLELFTGRACNPQTKPYELPVVWIGNYIGAAIMAVIAKSMFIYRADALVEGKLDKSFSELFIGGVVCGICIAVAVKGYKKTQNILVPMLGVTVFIVTGSEHCIADMFYFVLVGKLLILQLLTVTCGNLIGGALFYWI